jgi:hypothetical protein
MSCFARKRKRMVLSTEQTILSTENNVRPNREDSDHASILTIDVDQMQVHQVTSYKISQNPVGRIQISARHDYIK